MFFLTCGGQTMNLCVVVSGGWKEKRKIKKATFNQCQYGNSTRNHTDMDD